MSVLGGILGGVLGGVLGSNAAEADPTIGHYATLKGLHSACGGVEAFGELFKRKGSAELDEDLVEYALTTADEDINQYAAKRFRVPFDPVPPTIRTKAAQLARIAAEISRGVMNEDHDRRWKSFYSADKFDPGWLIQLGNGMVTPGTDPMPAKHGTMAVEQAIETLPSSRDVSREKLGGWW